MAATKCRNCGGPHRSESRKCLARPTRHGAPTREQLKIYRQAGDREFQAAIRARAAEQKASELEAAFLETEKAGDTERIIDEDVEVDNATVIRVPESPEPSQESLETQGDIQQGSVNLTADSTMEL